MRLNDNNTFIGINPPYQLSVIHSSKLIYPREIYQRGVERKRVELIARDFNEYIVNEPKVSFRNGRYYVMDGQHTIEGCILLNGGEDRPILCKVYTGLTMEQEALLFAEQNGHAAPLSAGIKLRAKVVGGDAPSKAFVAATNRAGLSLNYDSMQLSDYRIGCVGTALKLYDQLGEEILLRSSAAHRGSVGGQTGFLPGGCPAGRDVLCAAVSWAVQRGAACPCAERRPSHGALPCQPG